MPVFGQQGVDTRREQGVATGHGRSAEGAGAGLSGGDADHAGLLPVGAGPAFSLPAGLANAGHLSGNMGPVGLSARGDHGQWSRRSLQHNLANQLETIKVLIIYLCFSNLPIVEPEYISNR